MTMFLACGASAVLILAGCSSASDQPGNTTPVERPSGVVAGASSMRPSQSTRPASSATAADQIFAHQLESLLVGHATLDNAAVTGVRAIDKCHTTFVTAKGETNIDWTKAGNLAPRDGNGREISRLPSASGWHEMSVPLGEWPEPAGNVANRSSGAFGQLATECA
ncbi:hypothetical protein [Sphingomonas sanguinis]|jgi:hypothetical protein|uniref:Lipoprotein n=1 Tax=Sphingomonas sanguinis TaxID=33051 RepID=A0A7Y7QWT7_9SPHN|nr:hypothetical protein [Sphingomonas sanguinis]MBZ6382583.1 hypothetical protein [Sphingomonas sanguinis]NNG51726.1 hypothetical protein [Sphingomonas sanguinis]NNG54732.1 hypothetical protein [Sphingomonas sanguinis]NVP31881.1 hypothetical protein [Sphingomonas sanguinis]